MDIDKITGAFLALALGDALGAVHERGDEGAHWGKYPWTDDTQMSIDIAESLLARSEVDQDDIASRFVDSYDMSRGYGPGVEKILQRIKKGMPWAAANQSVYTDGSYGNGASMRAGPVGLFFANSDVHEIVDAAQKTAVITHAHPMGIEGAVIIALATATAVQHMETPQIIYALHEVIEQREFQGKLEVAGRWLQSKTIQDVNNVRTYLGNGIAAGDSAVTAVYCALSHRNIAFEKLLLYIRELGGDVDTIGAMSGVVWGANSGAAALPEKLLEQIEGREILEGLAQRFARSVLSR